MHELGVVFHCLDSVRRIAEENNVRKVSSVTVEIGEVSTVLPHLFEDCWKWAVKKETVLKDAEIKIERIPAVTFCQACGGEYPTVEYGKVCPLCGSDMTFLKEGNEIIIKEIEALD
ncbi:MAG: hydrogenase maturation nickel metallochaperone HypA [Candidatus Ornithospirochaeta sp.]